MKKIILSLLASALLITTTDAQRPGMKRQHRMGQQQKMMRQHPPMDLTMEQKQKMKSIHEGYRKNMMDLRKRDDITVKEWRDRMADLHKKHRTDLQGVFSPEQKMRMEKMRAERMQLHAIDAQARLDKMKIHMGLSQAQADKLKMQQKELREKMQALRNDQSKDWMAKKEEMRAMMENRKQTMKSILTEEQRKRMEHMRPGRMLRKPGKLS